MYKFQFLTIEEAETHIKTIHTDSDDAESSLFIILPKSKFMCQFQCKLCTFFHLGSDTVIKQHFKRHHKKINSENINIIFKCRACKKDFESVNDFNLHQDLHVQEYGSLMTRMNAKERSHSKSSVHASSYQKEKETYRKKETCREKEEIKSFDKSKERNFSQFERINSGSPSASKIRCIFWNR